MALPASSLSRACRSVADFVGTGIGATQNAVHVTIGSPSDAANLAGEPQHRLNLFFYRVEPFAFGMAMPDEPWRLRLHCLITAFSVEEDGTSAGENDLRVLGEVLRLFHERPILDPLGLNGEVVRLHAVLEPLDLDDLNHLWSTQGDLSLRPSLSYELALAPILPRTRRVPAPRVGATGLGVRSDADPLAPAGPVVVRGPAAGPVRVDDRRPDWAPEACFVDEEGCALTVAFAVGSAELAAFEPHVRVAGSPGAPVTLRWETWSPAGGWEPGPSTDTSATTTTIDPDDPVGPGDVAVALPFDDRAGQAALHPTRTWTRPDGAQVELRGDPLLVTLYEASP